MIQRKQTVYLILALAVTVACLCMPIGLFERHLIGDDSIMYNLWVIHRNDNDIAVWPLFALLSLSCPLNVLTILLFHYRKIQSKLCIINSCLLVVWYFIYAWFIYRLCPDATFHVTIGTSFPAVSFVLYLMAKSGIDADERLVRAADRIR